MEFGAILSHPVPFGKPQLHRLPTTSRSNMSSDQDNNLGCDHLVALEKIKYFVKGKRWKIAKKWKCIFETKRFCVLKLCFFAENAFSHKCFLNEMLSLQKLAFLSKNAFWLKSFFS